MTNGSQISKLFFVFYLICSPLYSEEVQISPLINLDEITPSYEEFDEEIFKQQNLEQLNSNLNKDQVSLKSVSLKILNKITAEVDTVIVSIKENFFYEDLRLYPIYCHKSKIDERPETSVYLNIYDNDDQRKIFSGWMLKTLPSISSMEHSLYDIWVSSCS
tara:strand:+ start:3765 stop:4247 length:483 start_codon:yes stop_codon:yes gene_type:complete